MKTIFMASLIYISLIACVFASGVSNLGPETYSIIAVTPEGGELAARNRAITDADKFCKSIDKELQVMSIKPLTNNMLSTGSVEITFRCLSKGKP